MIYLLLSYHPNLLETIHLRLQVYQLCFKVVKTEENSGEMKNISNGNIFNILENKKDQVVNDAQNCFISKMLRKQEYI